jgi:taurine--2-oxoglutarate transaminase
LGAVVVSEPIAQFFEDKMLYQGLTYFGHPMSCAAAIATLNVYEEECLIENSKQMGKVLGESLESIKQDYLIVGDVRYVGLFAVIELVDDRTTKQPLAPEIMAAIKSRLLADGLTTFINKNMIFVCPPLCINQGELISGMNIIRNALSKVSIV